MKDQLEGVNVLAFVVHGMVGLRLLTLPRDIAAYAENSGWASILLGGALAFIVGYCFYWLALQFPGLNFSELTVIVMGKYLGKAILVGIAFYTTTSLGLSLRAFGDSLKLFLLDRTPLFVLIAVMMVILVYGVSKGIKTISILFDLLLPFVLISIALLIFLSTSTMEKKNLLPVFSNGPMPVFKGFLQTIHPFLGIATLGYILPYFKDVKKTKRWIFIAIVTVIIAYVSIIAMCIMVFGNKEINQLIYPTLSLSKTVQLRTELFERMESLFMTVWIPISFTTMIGHYWAGILNSKVLFNTDRDHLIIFLHVPLFFIIALLPQNVVEVEYLLSLSNKLAQLLIFGVFPVVVIRGIIYRRRERQCEDS